MNSYKSVLRYLHSDNFKSLCDVLDFDYYDIEEIRWKVTDEGDRPDVWDWTTLLIHDMYLKCQKGPSSERIEKKYLHRMLYDGSEYCHRVLIRNPHMWEDIKNKLHAGIDSGKINSEHLLEKEFNRELDLMSVSDVDNALKDIYVAELEHLIDNHILDAGIEKTLLEDAFLSDYYVNPLYFADLRTVFEERLDMFWKNPIIKTERFCANTIFAKTVIIMNEKLASLIGEMEFKDKSQNCIFAKLMGYSGDYFYVITCGEGDLLSKRNNFSNVYMIRKELIGDCDSWVVRLDADFGGEFHEYGNSSIEKLFMEHKEDYINHLPDYDSHAVRQLDGFKMDVFEGLTGRGNLYVFDVPDNSGDVSDYNRRDIFEIASQRPLSREFLDLISALGLGVSQAYEIRDKASDGMDVLLKLNELVLKRQSSTDELSSEELLECLDSLKVKTILDSKESGWNGIREDIAVKINSGKIRSLHDLRMEYENASGSSIKANIFYGEINELLDFRQVDTSYAIKLAEHIRGNDILYSGLAKYLNSLVEPPAVMEKDYLDGGKYAAPRWLVYPELDPYTIGWRMGYGEAYAMNEPWPDEEFNRLFPKPKNWLFDPLEHGFKTLIPLGYFWEDDGKPKYSKITDDAMEVNGFITVEQDDGLFQYNANHFSSIEHAVLAAKYATFGKTHIRNTKLYVLKRGFELTRDEIEFWNKMKYSVLLNACYYKIMNNENLKRKLLDTGDATLVYVSDDEWGCEENLFGFALMELRDEIRRLYQNEDLIDWGYTEFLKNCNPYKEVPERNPEDQQSPEYRIIDQTLHCAKRYVRDVNLDEKLAEKYEIGQIITEKAFVDASSRIGGMMTTHRYTILSGNALDLSEYEGERGWGINVIKNNSRFKVIDIYSHDGKTQIALLQLPDGFEEVFENTISIEREMVEKLRSQFEEDLKRDVIEELAGPEWLSRCEFPIGMNDEGEFF